MASAPLRKDSDLASAALADRSARADGISAASWQDVVTPDFPGEWRDLAVSSAEPNPFNQEWFLRPALHALDPGGTVRLVQFRSDGRLCGLIPIAPSKSYYGYPLPHIRGWLHDNAFCGLPLVAEGFEREFWSTLFGWASSEFSTALLLHLAHIPADSRHVATIRQVLSDSDMPGSIAQREERAMLQSSLASDTYFEASMSGKKRKELRRQERRLSERGEVDFMRQSGGATIDGWIESFLALELAGWKGKEGSALASDPATETFFRETLSAAAEAGALERLTLSVDGKPIAMLANFLTPPGAFSFKTAFDEDYARYSPGVLLQKRNLELLDNPDIDWTDSCAAADHPMIERIWREKREMLRINIALGGPVRKLAFRQMRKSESGAEPLGDL